MSGAVVIQTAWLGDMVLTTPLLVALAERHGPVDVVTTPDAAPLIATHPAVRRVHAWRKRGSLFGAVSLLRMAARLRSHGYDAAYLPHRSVRSSLLARLSGTPARIGFADAPALARRLYTQRRERRGAHEAERILSLAGAEAPSRLSLGITPSDHAAAAAALSAAGIAEPFVVLAPGSARATKRWPHFAELARRLQLPVVVVGAPDDAGLLGQVTARIGGRPYADLAGRLMVRETAAVIARAELVVSNDSAAMHMAQAVGTPVLALFGPTVPALGFGPRGEHDRVVELDLPCRPCSTHGGDACPLGHHRCLKDLSPDVVSRRVDEALATSPPAPLSRGERGNVPRCA